MLLGVSGSVAAIKVPIIARLLLEFCEVIVIATDASRKLLQVEQLEAMHLPVKGAPSPCHTDQLSDLKAMLSDAGWRAASPVVHQSRRLLPPSGFSELQSFLC